MKIRSLPLFKLPPGQDLILFLIKQELLGTRFLNDLQGVGFGGEVFSMDLGVAILSLMGFHDRTDELWEWYFETLNAFAERVNLSEDTTADQLALEFYVELRGRN
ncbi:hypothetical protein [Reichenbachiella sp.]|uniref:hypothetical protein n=1 Tax=Reichenbachiella sp. TaxID=2184521 RepID=UPI003296844E